MNRLDYHKLIDWKHHSQGNHFPTAFHQPQCCQQFQGRLIRHPWGWSCRRWEHPLFSRRNTFDSFFVIARGQNGSGKSKNGMKDSSTRLRDKTLVSQVALELTSFRHGGSVFTHFTISAPCFKLSITPFVVVDLSFPCLLHWPFNYTSLRADLFICMAILAFEDNKT